MKKIHVLAGTEKGVTCPDLMVQAFCQCVPRIRLGTVQPAQDEVPQKITY